MRVPMTTVTRQKIEVTRKRNEAAIKAADRRSEELQAALSRSRATMRAALDALKRAGYVK
jgi:DNA-binding GntR family transcriptional regulator